MVLLKELFLVVWLSVSISDKLACRLCLLLLLDFLRALFHEPYIDIIRVTALRKLWLSQLFTVSIVSSAVKLVQKVVPAK